MPKFKVLRPIEHDGKYYIPGDPAQGGTPKKTLSRGHGLEIDVDASGVIELRAEEAAVMVDGQLEPVKKKS